MTTSTAETPTKEDSCYLYLAPSSIPGAGMGVFSTRPFSRGSTILASDYGPLIPIIDGNAVHDHWLQLFNNYIWGHFSMAPDQLWYEAESVTDYQLGLGIFPNYHPFLINIGAELAENVTYYTDDDEDNDHDEQENTHCGSSLTAARMGAYSDYVGRSFFTIADIQAGDELFLDYGEQYLNDRSPYMDRIPRSLDYEMAGQIVEQVTKDFLLLVRNKEGKVVEDAGGEETSSLALLLGASAGISNATTTNSISDQEELANQLLLLLRRSLEASVPRVASLIPSNFQELQEVVTSARVAMQLRTRRNQNEEDIPLEQEEDGKSIQQQDYGIALAKLKLIQRNVTWIQENGVCIDNIIAGFSDMPLAGRGAKARRTIHKGDLIAPMPLLHVRHEEEFFTYQMYHTSNGGFVMDKNDQVSKQLLYNYCFGDADISLLLCPTTNGILVNHCSDTCDSPNAEVRWSNDTRTQKWLQKTTEEISREKSWVLSFDLVATRDIAKGEEIFIDYGEQWVNAWKAYEERMINQVRDESSKRQHSSSSASSDMFSACYYWEDGDVENDLDPDIPWQNFDDTTAIQNLGRDGSKFQQLNAEGEHRGSFWPCSILEKQISTSSTNTAPSHPENECTTYTVRIFPSRWHDISSWAKNDIPRILTNFPASSVKMFYKPYRSPMHSRDAFRHYVGIPSHIIPAHWKRTDATTSSEPIRTFRIGDRVAVKDKNSNSWRTGTLLLANDDSPMFILDDGDVILNSNIRQENVRWATSHLMQVVSKTHPFN
eukprot:CAMPEP_0176500726 /NCGR_PEP_ID=MMETSP0200_2-20121128/13742_1 /TAXON_ID=947934 /ORGANISM="Chaetoceros sp., Strain GSL56" /LENGTH=770 /DNA_ID=CAMNT_0017899487 /DNA_START=430 /DNA_END=2742 /DNA_ORIENTATION=-